MGKGFVVQQSPYENRARQPEIPLVALLLCRRMDYKPHLIRWSDVKGEALTGKHYLYDTLDKEGRPMILMRPRFENTKVRAWVPVQAMGHTHPGAMCCCALLQGAGCLGAWADG